MHHTGKECCGDDVVNTKFNVPRSCAHLWQAASPASSKLVKLSTNFMSVVEDVFH